MGESEMFVSVHACPALFITTSQLLPSLTSSPPPFLSSPLLSHPSLPPFLSLYVGLLKLGLRTTFSHIVDQLQRFVEVTDI